MNQKERIKQKALDNADFSNVFQARTAWERGFDAAWAALSRKHVYWNAGDPDCPKDIKAGNGELHTLRCTICGLDRPKGPCEGKHEEDAGEYNKALEKEECGVITWGDLLDRLIDATAEQIARACVEAWKERDGK